MTNSKRISYHNKAEQMLGEQLHSMCPKCDESTMLNKENHRMYDEDHIVVCDECKHPNIIDSYHNEAIERILIKS